VTQLAGASDHWDVETEISRPAVEQATVLIRREEGLRSRGGQTEEPTTELEVVGMQKLRLDLCSSGLSGRFRATAEA